MMFDYFRKLDLGFDFHEFYLDQRDFTDVEYGAYFGIARIMQPESVLEIGVYRGISASTIFLGSPKIKKYVGLDSEMYIDGSNQIAKDFINAVISKTSVNYPWMKDINIRIEKINTMVDPVPPDILESKFDWIHVDGDHTYDGAIKDISLFWPLVKSGGIMTVHDYEEGHAEVKAALDKVMLEHSTYLPDLDCHLVIKSVRNFVVLRKR
jgi:predicted O-methyltransferase YrrM